MDDLQDSQAADTGEDIFETVEDLNIEREAKRNFLVTLISGG